MRSHKQAAKPSLSAAVPGPGVLAALFAHTFDTSSSSSSTSEQQQHVSADSVSNGGVSPSDAVTGIADAALLSLEFASEIKVRFWYRPLLVATVKPSEAMRVCPLSPREFILLPRHPITSAIFSLCAEIKHHH